MALRTFQLCIVFTIGRIFTNQLALSDTTTESPAPTPSLDQPPLSVYLHQNIQHVRIVPRGQSITIDCPVTPGAGTFEAAVTYSWFLNNHLIDATNSTIYKQYPNGTLFIAKMSRKKSGGSVMGGISSIEGEYRCNFTNNVGTVITEPITLKFPMLAKTFLEQPRNETVVEGDTVIFNCRITSVPEANIIWERNSERITSKRFKQLPNGSLLIIEVQKGVDEGAYSCVASNRIQKNQRESISGILTVLPMGAGAGDTKSLLNRKPEIVNKSEYNNMVVNTKCGDDVNLYCFANGQPKPRIRWEVPFNNSYSKTISTNNNLLSLTNISGDHANNYTCVAQNANGNDTQTWAIHIAPYFILTPNSRHVPPAQTVRLNCSAGGYPPPRIVWLKDGELLLRSKNNKYTNRNTKIVHGRITIKAHNMEIADTVTSDSGLYQCVATNNIGEVRAVARILVRALPKRLPPPPPPSNLSCRPFSPTSICLRWQPTLPNVPRIQAYTVHYMKLDGGPEQQHATNETHSLVDLLEPMTKYLFYLRAYIREAASEQSNAVICQGYVLKQRDTKLVLVSSEVVEVWWNPLLNDTPCGEIGQYKVQWRRQGHASNSVKLVTAHIDKDVYSYQITDLTPSQTYEVRVLPFQSDDNIPWLEITMPSNANYTTTIKPLTNQTETITNLEAYPVSSTVINLVWTPTDSSNYTISYTEDSSKLNSTTVIPSSTHQINVTSLRPYTLYKFQVRAKNGNYSDVVECRTLEGQSSEVRGLGVKFVNSSTRVVDWMMPSHPNGIVRNFVVFYVSVVDTDLPLTKWFSIVVGSSVFHVLIPNLQPNAQYNVTVYAINGAGKGKSASIVTPFIPFFPIGTATPQGEQEPNLIQYKRNQSVAIIIGCGLASLCIALCIAYMMWYRRCLKMQQQHLQRNSNATDELLYNNTLNGYEIPIPQRIRRDDGEVHEMEYLVASTVPDTKGGPNGHIVNGAKIANGGVVRIIENPRQQYESGDVGTTPKRSSNGDGGNNNNKHKLHESECESGADDEDFGNSTQLTNLNYSVLSGSPIIIPPNG